MFRFKLPVILFSAVIVLGACSPSNNQSPQSPTVKNVERETQVLVEGKDDNSTQVEKSAKLAQAAKLAEEKFYDQELRRAEEILLDEKQATTIRQNQINAENRIQQQEKQTAKKKIAEEKAQRIVTQKLRLAADRAAETAQRKALQAKAQKEDAQRQAESIALLAETLRQEELQKQAEIDEQLQIQEAQKLKAESLKDRVIAYGSFTKKKKPIKGSWSIVMEGGKRYLRFDEAFKTKWVDDLQIFLSPQSITEATHKNAGQNVYRLAPLKAKKGAQSYAIPDNVDLSLYNSILIHCEEYDLLWGGTDIR